MKAFLGSQDVKRRAMQDAALARMGGHFYGWGHYWHPENGGKCRGNVAGALLNVHLQPGQVEQDLPGYWEPVLGIPWLVGEMIDRFFSGLCLHDDKEIHTRWAEMVVDAIRPGADLSSVPDRLVAYILEQPEWLAAYADDWAHHVGLMHSIVLLRLNGIDQAARVEDFYHAHIHKLHRHQTDGRSTGNEARAALRSLATLYRENRQGPLGYFLQHAVHGSAVHKRENKGKRWAELSQIFLQMIEDSPA
jgi:hypothetical protein